MTLAEQQLLIEWQSQRHLPPAERLAQYDYERTLELVDFALNAPEFDKRPATR